MRAVRALWAREILRFVRQRSRVIGSLAQPIVFWALLGGGFSASFRPGASAGEGSYLEYFYAGSLALVLLFTAIFATISVVEDRRSGFLQGVLVAPVSRVRIVLGQALGATSLGVGQGVLFLLLSPPQVDYQLMEVPEARASGWPFPCWWRRWRRRRWWPSGSPTSG